MRENYKYILKKEYHNKLLNYSRKHFKEIIVSLENKVILEHGDQGNYGENTNLFLQVFFDQPNESLKMILREWIKEFNKKKFYLLISFTSFSKNFLEKLKNHKN